MGKRVNGYTIIEFLATILLLSVILAISTPSLIDQLSYYYAREASMSTLNMLQLCRSQSLTSQETVECEIDYSFTQDRLITEMKMDVDDNGLLEILYSHRINSPSNLVASNLTDSPLIITFNERGRADISSEIRICSTMSNIPTSDYKININLSGFVVFNQGDFDCT